MVSISWSSLVAEPIVWGALPEVNILITWISLQYYFNFVKINGAQPYPGYQAPRLITPNYLEVHDTTFCAKILFQVLFYTCNWYTHTMDLLRDNQKSQKWNRIS